MMKKAKKDSFWYVEELARVKEWSLYRIAKETGISIQGIYRMKKKRIIGDDYFATQVAEMLDINPMEIIAKKNEEIEKDEDKKKFWKSYFNRVATVFFMVGLIGTLSNIGGDFQSIEGRKSTKFFKVLTVSALIIVLSYLT